MSTDVDENHLGFTGVGSCHAARADSLSLLQCTSFRALSTRMLTYTSIASGMLFVTQISWYKCALSLVLSCAVPPDRDTARFDVLLFGSKQ